MAYIPEIKRVTSFDENVTAQRTPLVSYKPTWGVSKLNYDIMEVSGGIATGSLSGSGYEGTIQLSTGNNVNGHSSIRTKLLGEYQAVLFVKMDTPAANEFVKATLEWEEEW